MSYNKPKVQITFQGCGKVFEVIPSEAHRKFCSTACASPEKKVKLTCERCGKEYETRPSKASGSRFCSRKCRKSQVEVTCDVCGKVFEINTYQAERGRRFCSRACRNNAQIEVTCETCGKTFKVMKSRTARATPARYCSKACIPPAKKITRICETCGKSFEVWPSRAESAKYCSPDCVVPAYYGKPGVAKDGHKVRSGLEMAVDDWLFEHGIQHELEPHCPWDKSPHPRRADFKVGDVYIEVWGLAGKTKYDKRRAQKVAKYAEHGIKLIEILPAHVLHGDFSPLESLLAKP